MVREDRDTSELCCPSGLCYRRRLYVGLAQGTLAISKHRGKTSSLLSPDKRGEAEEGQDAGDRRAGEPQKVG